MPASRRWRRSALVVQPEAHLQGDLELVALVALDPPADPADLEPVQVVQGPAGAPDRALDRVVDAYRRRADDLADRVDVVRHGWSFRLCGAPACASSHSAQRRALNAQTRSADQKAPSSGGGLPGPAVSVYVRGVQGTPFLTVLRELAQADPARPAVTFGDDTLTRADLVSRVENLAALFARLGVAQGATVTIGLPNSVGFVEAMFATWALGAVPQPISDRLPSRERAAIVELADPALAVGVPAAESGGRPVLESVPRDLPPGPFTPGVAPEWKRMTSGGSTGRAQLDAAAQPA